MNLASLLGRFLRNIDWWLLSAASVITLAGLFTMNSFTADQYFFGRQILWFALGLIAFFAAANIDWRFLRRTGVVVAAYVLACLVLLGLYIFGNIFQGAQSWFDLGQFALQPVDPAKLVLILILAKYFTRRHMHIARIEHMFISGIYAALLALLVFFQPDFGSAIIIFLIWFGMVFVSGISRKHFFGVLLLVATVFAGLWFFAFEDYQKQRIITFVNPLTDIRGAGYSAHQSTIAVGSGQILGKGLGFGTQSKLKFLPEYETDFIFAAFAEEWGFVGCMIILACFGIVFWRILSLSYRAATNFEALYGLGVFMMLAAHTVIHIGMNIGITPITGTPLPFMSYGGSHLITEYFALGMLVGMSAYAQATHGDKFKEEGDSVPIFS